MKGELKIYNSITKNKEIFSPINNESVGMYVCGPTVYNFVHLGNCRTFVFFDIVYRYLIHLGYKVRYVRNITDVGHLEDDTEDSEDKLLKKARLENLEPREIAQKYTYYFHMILLRLNTLPPNIEPTATGHIAEQIEMIEDIINDGFAYISNGSVYFDVVKYNEKYSYGKLSRRDIEKLIHNSRELKGQSEKKNSQDFALWKKASKNHIMRWKSPWGEGFPGWHIECSAMSKTYLGDSFDIHGGGMDLKFPHHDCEIAQSNIANRSEPGKYWMHTNMLTLNGDKMSKSKGNVLLPSDLFSGENSIFKKGFSPSAVKLFMLQAHYRSTLDISEEALEAAEKGYIKLMKALSVLDRLAPSEESTFDVKKWVDSCYEAINDDFNTSVLIANLFNLTKIINRLELKTESISKEDLTLLSEKIRVFIFEILGLEQSVSYEKDRLKEVLNILIEVRNNARKNRDWKLSDQIRDKLNDIGISLKDGENQTDFPEL
ncbi:cysteine--tRNA ligase [Ichthyobacterium seriolicida]|uniref:Cysteine--tRNA ligase n=1 Tax=Ichthyobacterium seriolicida TaxID=242600 RepID=A0A1J1DZI5_9FLAO|nr:cysteine--tRNA ligase [Ichthyobacterium seriolicida]BAV95305.1 cysteinyl-tRNA synthetase [Ichthyobacterium seriolicida]